MTRPDPYSIIPNAILDAGVVRAIAHALDGRWQPADEADPIARQQRIDAARLRLYGERDRCGWYLVTDRKAWEAGMEQYDANWSVGFLPTIDDFEDAPARSELDALIRTHSQSGLDPEHRRSLAWAQLYEPVQALVSFDPLAYRHNRELDLPARLEIITPAELFGRFDIKAGEREAWPLPADHPLAAADPWWVP